MNNTSLDNKLNTSSFNTYSANTLTNVNSRLLSSIFNTHTGNTVLNNYVIVKSLSNFPTPIANSIQLVNGIEYRINGTINIGNNRLVLGIGNTLIGENTTSDSIVSTFSGATIFGRGKSITLLGLTFINTVGKIFDVIGDNTLFFVARRCIYSNSRIGNVGSFGTVVLDSMVIDTIKSGIVFSGQSSNQGGLSIRNAIVRSSQTGSTAITVTGGSFNAIDISLCFFNMPTNTTALKINSGSTLTNFGNLLGNQFFGNGTYVSGTLTKAAFNWIFSQNSNLDDSTILGFLKFSGNSTTTTIASTTAFVKAAGTNSFFIGERVDTNSTNNRLRYISSLTRQFNVVVTGDIFVNANNQTLYVALYKNGTTRIGNVIVRTGTSGTPVSFAYNDTINLALNDFLEIFVRNSTALNNVVVENLQFRITSNV